MPAKVPIPDPIVPDGLSSPDQPAPARATARARAGWYAPIKVSADFVLALGLLLLALPLLVVLAALVRLTSRGPALYTQTRLGQGGRIYSMYKIRTMEVDSERTSGPRWSDPQDPRVTPIGRILRSTHLDELPQLWNVLRGEMSLVGPRPERPEFLNQLERAFPYYRQRLSVRPGLTGLAQVQLPPDVSLGCVRRKLACDLYYVEHRGPGLDLRILLSTPLSILGAPLDWSRILFRLPCRTVIEATVGLPAEEHVPVGAVGMYNTTPEIQHA